MSKPAMTRYAASALLEKLADQGNVLPDNIAEFVLSQQQKPELPLYLRILAGVGAFIASLFFIGFLGVSGIIHFSNEVALISWGGVFVAGAVGLQRLANNRGTVSHSFIMQLSFAFMAVGKALFIVGVGDMSDSGWGVSLALLLITAVTYFIYRLSIDRFLSSFAVLISVLMNILWGSTFADGQELLFNGFFLLQFIGAAILLTHGKVKPDYIPLSYALVFSLCASVLFLASHGEFDYWRGEKFIRSGFINSVLAGGLVALIAWAAGGLESLKNKSLALASVGAILFALISAPGVILAIGLMVLGYAKHEKLLIITGALLMPVFIFLYYYNLDVSLMQKSGVLIASGFVLLLGRFYLQSQKWGKEAGSCV